MSGIGGDESRMLAALRANAVYRRSPSEVLGWVAAVESQMRLWLADLEHNEPVVQAADLAGEERDAGEARVQADGVGDEHLREAIERLHKSSLDLHISSLIARLNRLEQQRLEIGAHVLDDFGADGSVELRLLRRLLELLGDRADVVVGHFEASMSSVGGAAEGTSTARPTGSGLAVFTTRGGAS